MFVSCVKGAPAKLLWSAKNLHRVALILMRDYEDGQFKIDLSKFVNETKSLTRLNSEPMLALLSLLKLHGSMTDEIAIGQRKKIFIKLRFPVNFTKV